MTNKLDKKNLAGLFSKISFILLGLMVVLATITLPNKTVEAASFNQNNIISNTEFIDVDSMGTVEVQRFLETNNSYLKNYTQNGRTAAQIIYGAAQGHDEASGTLGGIVINTTTGTVSPKVLLVTLQKEQSLISRTTRSDAALRTAMGYACPDSGGCNPKYAGFTKQVENAAWQLRYNYERSQGYGYPDYQVGQTKTFSDYNGNHTVNFTNRATSALYRYTPHTYNGNYNFWNLYFNSYQFQLSLYAGSWAGQNPINPGSTSRIMINSGQTANASISFKNTGSETWGNNVRLAVADDASARFVDSSWLSSYRIASSNDTEYGQTATYNFKLKAPANLAPGTYRFKVELVSENIRWMPETISWWDVKIPTQEEQYTGAWAWQTPINPGQTSRLTINPGSSTDASITFKNTGTSAWDNNVRLGVAYSSDTNFNNSSWTGEYRIAEAPITQPGKSATFRFKLTAPGNMKPGKYRFNVELVKENVRWMPETITWWDVTIPTAQQAYTGAWAWQTPINPGQTSQLNIARGQTANASITFKNTGSAAWDPNVRLGVAYSSDTNFYDPSWTGEYRIAEAPATQPGESRTFNFKIKIPANLKPGRYRFNVELVKENVRWMPETLTWWDVNVQ